MTAVRRQTALLLTLLIASVYGPFLGSRFIRTAGDEKVYISQAIEMERAGHWFVQTLQDEPNYYKGPIHYILLRVGMKIFGRGPWAVLYMNPVFLLLGALSIAAIARRRFPHWEDGDLWIGTAFALGTGIYAHAFASQMEIELAGLYALGLYCLDRNLTWRFWIVAGVIGWVKSPLHSFFLGMTAVLYWSLMGEIVRRLRDWREWTAVLMGVAISIVGYFPAYFLDQKNFWEAYVIRENLRKSDGSGQDWSVAVVSTFGFYLFPWVLPAWISFVQCVQEKRWRSLALPFAAFLPSVVFFCWHIYRFENYNLPVIAGVWLWAAVGWSPPKWDAARRWSIRVTGVLLFTIPVMLTLLAERFSPTPQWWPSWLLPIVWAGTLVTVIGFLFAKKLRWITLSSAGYLWALGALFVVIGEREMVDLRNYLKIAAAENRTVELGYYNLNRNIWSEWGYLGFWVGHEVHGLHTPEALTHAVQSGETILVSAKEDGVRDFHDFMKAHFPNFPTREIPWKRWRTRGQSDSGKPLWREAWDTRDLSKLEVDYLIVETR